MCLHAPSFIWHIPSDERKYLLQGSSTFGMICQNVIFCPTNWVPLDQERDVRHLHHPQTLRSKHWGTQRERWMKRKRSCLMEVAEKFCFNCIRQSSHYLKALKANFLSLWLELPDPTKTHNFLSKTEQLYHTRHFWYFLELRSLVWGEWGLIVNSWFWICVPFRI